MKLSNYQTEIRLGLLLLLVTLAMPDFSFARGSQPNGNPTIVLGPSGLPDRTHGDVDFGADQESFSTGELAYAPGLAAAIAYVAGSLFAFSGILKLPKHI